MPKSALRAVGVLVATLGLLLTACGGDDDGTTSPDDGNGDGAPVANACPAGGCEIQIEEVAREGDELQVTWRANFLPDLSRNHIHVYWDIYTADQVSDDAEDRGVTQGDWHPTDAYPGYLTESAASLANRGESTMICVTAADRDHNVLDAGIVDCRDVSDLI